MEGQNQSAEYLAQQRYKDAIAFYEQAIAAEPARMSNYWYLGLALLLEGQESEAQLTWISALAQVNSEQVQDYTAELIEVLATEAQRQQAVSHLSVAWLLRQYICQFTPENFNNLLALVWLSIELELFQTQGKLALLQATQLILAEQSLEVDQALLKQVLEKLLEINPYHDFIEICLLQNQLIADIQQASQLKKKLAMAYINLGSTLYNQKHFSSALSNLQKVIELQPDFEKRQLAELNLNVGLTLMGLNEFEQAASWFEEALKLDQSLNLAVAQLVQAKYQAGNKVKGYQFTQDWFSRSIPVWQQALSHLAHVPELKVLEIGSWEGRSTCWLLENILTHETASITCLDTFEGSLEHHEWYEKDYIKSVEQRFDFNIAKTGTPEKVQKLIGRSQDLMRSLPLNAFDLLYIDGSHLASDVLEDAVIGWRLVKVGGIIIFDDYYFTFDEFPEQNTQIGIDAFMAAFSQKVEVIYQGYQVIIQKTSV
jgi:tetratricopeptide (TPR) repeat protein